MRAARHLGANCCQRLALQIGIVTISCDIALILGTEAVVALSDGDLGGDPKDAPKTCIAELRELRLAAKLARLIGRQIEPAEL